MIGYLIEPTVARIAAVKILGLKSFIHKQALWDEWLPYLWWDYQGKASS